jgi:NADPH:quinone reductase-like Zn-dependent oxidoreductase
MRAIRLHPPGGIEALSVDEVPTPRPGDGEVLVRVHAAALTRDELDWPDDRLPAVPSYELSGTVTGVGDSHFQPGQAVYGMTGFDRDGVAAEYASVPVGELSPKPESLSHVDAAALPLPGLSAMQGLFDHGLLAKGHRVLIHGGGGGVGSYAVQLARLHGAHVIATVSTARVEAARLLGADEVIDHPSNDFTAIDPVDLVFDTAGGNRLARSVEVVKPGGRLVSVAEDPPLEQASAADIEALWFLVESRQDQLAELARLADREDLRVGVNRTYPLAEAREAFTHLQEGGATGKIVLSVTSESG